MRTGGGSALLPAEPRVVRVAYFSGNPELSDHLEILNALLRLLKEWQSHQERTTALRVVVRIHPRTPAPIKEQLVAACEGAFARGAVRNKPPARSLRYVCQHSWPHLPAAASLRL